MFFFLLSFFKKGDNIQGEQYLRKDGIYLAGNPQAEKQQNVTVEED